MRQKPKLIEVSNEYTVHDQQGESIADVRQVGQALAPQLFAVGEASSSRPLSPSTSPSTRSKPGLLGRATPYRWDVRQVPSVEDAISLAARAHRGQRYPSPEREPYIFHPLRVMLSLNGPADQIVGVLHDTVEDTDIELRHLVEACYPSEIVAAVDSLTRRAQETYDEYIERVAVNEIGRRVKLADLRENLANNLRLPTSPGSDERIAQYERALTRLGNPR